MFVFKLLTVTLLPKKKKKKVLKGRKGELAMSVSKPPERELWAFCAICSCSFLPPPHPAPPLLSSPLLMPRMLTGVGRGVGRESTHSAGRGTARATSFTAPTFYFLGEQSGVALIHHPNHIYEHTAIGRAKQLACPKKLAMFSKLLLCAFAALDIMKSSKERNLNFIQFAYNIAGM